MTEFISEGFGNIPNTSATFGTFPQSAEDFRTMRNSAERTEQHTLTVREVARLFEQAGVPRTERSIVNWCQQNRQGVARLDAFFDTNEQKYFITPQSVSLAIREEQAKAGGNAAATPPPVKEKTPNSSENTPRPDTGGSEHAYELTRQNRDLEIATRAKDYYIERLEKERGQYVEKLVGMSRYVGELESQVLQLGGAPRGDRNLPQGAETIGEAAL